ncbi:hypothetical protein BD410DRAFT_688256, partial [Rickenella mellea]
KYFSHPLDSAHPICTVSMLIAVVLNIFGHVAYRMCNMTLQMLQVLIEVALTTGRQPTPFEEELIHGFPKDFRTVRKRFDLDPETTTYATCPKCCSTYEPVQEGKIQVYP